MFNAVIVEDEIPILNLMKYVIGQNPYFTIIGAFTSSLEALTSLSELQYRMSLSSMWKCQR